MTDLVLNPYDFANPVDSLEYFAGRADQISDVSYYLGQAKHGRPIHLALTGERSAGKTSMLNLIGSKAERDGFLVVRVNLSVADAAPLPFFQRIYDAVLMALVEDGKFGGISGTTWTSYRNLVDADVPAPDLILGFPAHSGAVLSGKRTLSIPVLTRDLKLMQAEADKKLVVVLDECNVLSSEPSTLQILRNLFSDLERFLFVIAGTPQLFPVFDEVFSPIVRQFKKLDISPFEKTEETSECISQPLRKVNLDPEEAFDDWPDVVDEVHRITGGRPYEIQLLCHAMFRRMQEGKEKDMRVNFGALDAVRQDLQHNQQHNMGRLSHSFSSLSKTQLRAIAAVRRLSNGAAGDAFAFELISPLQEEHVQSKSRSAFERTLDELAGSGVLTKTNDRFELAGDQFDELYLRYHAETQGVRIPANPLPRMYLLSQIINRTLNDLSYARHYYSPRGETTRDIEDRVRAMLQSDSEAGTSIMGPREWAVVYLALRAAQNAGQTQLNFVVFEVNVASTHAVVYYPHLGNDLAIALASEAHVDFIRRLETAGGTVIQSNFSIDISDCLDAIELMPEGVEYRDVVADYLEADGYAVYDQGDFQASSKLFEAAFQVFPTSNSAVSVAYQALLLEDWAGAIQWADIAQNATARAGETVFSSLASYDKSLALLMSGRADEALAEAKVALRNYEGPSDDLSIVIHTAIETRDGFALERAKSNLENEIKEVIRLLEARR